MIVEMIVEMIAEMIVRMIAEMMMIVAKEDNFEREIGEVLDYRRAWCNHNDVYLSV